MSYETTTKDPHNPCGTHDHTVIHVKPLPPCTHLDRQHKYQDLNQDYKHLDSRVDETAGWSLW